MKCPICEKGELKRKLIDEKMFGIPLGRCPAKLAKFLELNAGKEKAGIRNYIEYSLSINF